MAVSSDLYTWVGSRLGIVVPGAELPLNSGCDWRSSVSLRSLFEVDNHPICIPTTRRARELYVGPILFCGRY